MMDGRISESIKELIFNAIKAISKTSRKSGTINITSKLIKEKKGGVVLVRVEDSGPGFPQNFPIFEPFNSTDTQSTGFMN